jgi:hypothetical protein
MLRRLGFKVYVLDDTESDWRDIWMKYEPHDYQAYAIDYIETHPISAVSAGYGPWQNEHHADRHE